MRKYIVTLALCALTMLGFNSCNRMEQPIEQVNGPKSITFCASLSEQSKTGLAMKFVPNWINTAIENVHLYEIFQGEATEGTDVEMTTPIDGSYELAHFKASFGQDMSIIVTPPSTKAGAETYTYSGVVAQQVDGKFVIPAVQNPNSVSLIDPNADFLVGDGQVVYQDSKSDEQVDLHFVRPVCASRLAIMNIEGQLIKTVKIVSADKLTASAAYSAIDFANGTVTFDETNGSETITMSYGAGVAVPAESTFYAYFLSLPGSKRILSIEVTTDQYIYTKSFAAGKTLSFSTADFKNIAVDMSKVTPVPSTGVLQDQELYFLKGSNRISEDSYELSAVAYVSPTLKGVATGATVTYESSNTAVATVANDGTVTPVAKGSAVITAKASATAAYNAAQASYALTVTEPASSAKNYVKSSGNIVPGTYLIVVQSQSGSYYAFDANEASAGYKNKVTPAEGVIASSASVDAAAVELSEKNGKYFIKTSAGYLYTVSGSAPNVAFSSTADDSYLHEVAVSATGDVTFKNKAGRSSEYYLNYGGSSTYVFRYYSSATEFELYLLEGTATAVKQDRNLSFAQAEVTKNVGDAPFTNALSGNTAGVVYSSSNEAVATVAASGVVTVVGAGTATITAAAEATATLNAGSAQFTITVTSPATPAVTAHYEKVTSVSQITDNGKYIIVFDNGSSSKVFKPIYSNGAFASENTANAINAVVADSTIEASDAIDACQVILEANTNSANYYYIRVPKAYNGTDYYFVLNNGSATFQAQTERGYSSEFAINAGVLTMSRNMNGSVQYMYYSTYSSFFKAKNSEASEMQLALYKYVEGNGSGTVTPSTDKTFKKVSSFTSGKKYVIVDGTNALKNDNGTDEAYSVAGKVSGNTLTVAADAAEAITWTAGTNNNFTAQGSITLKNGSYYLARGNTSVNNDVVLVTTVNGYAVWSFDGQNLNHKNSSGAYTFHVFYDGSRWNAEQQSATNNITIYEEN